MTKTLVSRTTSLQVEQTTISLTVCGYHNLDLRKLPKIAKTGFLTGRKPAVNSVKILHTKNSEYAQQK